MTIGKGLLDERLRERIAHLLNARMSGNEFREESKAVIEALVDQHDVLLSEIAKQVGEVAARDEEITFLKSDKTTVGMAKRERSQEVIALEAENRRLRTQVEAHHVLVADATGWVEKQRTYILQLETDIAALRKERNDARATALEIVQQIEDLEKMIP